MIINLKTFNHIVNEYQANFILFANSYLHDNMEAEDIVMESFMYYWLNRERLPKDTNIPAYILTTVKHKCIDKLRQQRIKLEVSGIHEELHIWELNSRINTLENFDPHEIFIKEIECLIKETLNKLPYRTQQIFLMSRFENKSYNEIAVEFGITTKGVEFHIAKVIKILRKKLKDYLPLYGLYLSSLYNSDSPILHFFSFFY